MLVLGSSAIVMLLLCFIEYVGSFPSYFLKPSVTLNEFIKHYEPAFYNVEEVTKQHKRIKRGAGSYEKNNFPLRLTITTSNRVFKLLLRPDQSLFADDVEFEGAKGKKIDFDVGTAYIGTLEDDERTKVRGIITGDGLFDGTITTQFEEFYVEPLSRYREPSAGPADPHSIVYRISDVVHPHSPLCAISSSLAGTQKPTDLNTIAHRSKEGHSHQGHRLSKWSEALRGSASPKIDESSVASSKTDGSSTASSSETPGQRRKRDADDKWPSFENLLASANHRAADRPKEAKAQQLSGAGAPYHTFAMGSAPAFGGAPRSGPGLPPGMLTSHLGPGFPAPPHHQQRGAVVDFGSNSAVVDFGANSADGSFYDLDSMNGGANHQPKVLDDEGARYEFNDEHLSRGRSHHNESGLRAEINSHWRPKSGIIDSVFRYTNLTKSSKGFPPPLPSIVHKSSPKILVGNGIEESRPNSIIMADDGLELHARKRAIVDPRKTTCMLYLQADHLFFEKYGTEETCIEVMTRHVQRVNSIYRNTDFNLDGKPDNISFMIKRIKVHSIKDPSYRFPGNYGVEKFLEIFSEEDYDAFCLAYMFTYRDFEMGTLGLAWTGDLKNAGGVCEKNGHYRGSLKSLNTGIVTVLNYGKHVPSAVSHVTLAHEIGHNFGSPHDPDGCTPGGDDGNFIMFARATSGDKKNNNKFSPCSLHAINPVLNVKARSSKGCFTEPQTSICGNGVVEPGEECDCGWEEDCKDKCCYPQRRYPPVDETPCRLTPNSRCSPSQGPCCTAECTIKVGDMCRSDNGCRDASYCNGMSPQCPPSINKPNKTVCNEEFVCYMGECTGSICLAYGLESCQCIPTPSDPPTKACELCCKMPGENQPCLSSFQFNQAPYDVPNMYAKPGTPCNDYNGYCDVFRKCREVDPSGPIATLRKLLLSEENIASFKKWALDRWYYCALIFLCFFLLMFVSTKILGKKKKVKAVTVVHSSPTEPVRLPTDSSGGPAVVVHPVAIRSKLPFKKKVHENKRRSKSAQPKEEPMLHNVNNNNSPVEVKKKKSKRHDKGVTTGATQPAGKSKTAKPKKTVVVADPKAGAAVVSEDPLGKVRNWLINSHNIEDVGSLKKSQSSPAGFDLSDPTGKNRTKRTNPSAAPPAAVPATTPAAGTPPKAEAAKKKPSKDRVKLQLVYKPPFKFSVKLGKNKNEISSHLIKDKRPEAVKQRAALLVRADRIRSQPTKETVTAAAPKSAKANEPVEASAKPEEAPVAKTEYKRSVSAPQEPLYQNTAFEAARGDEKHGTQVEPCYANVFGAEATKNPFASEGRTEARASAKASLSMGMKRRNSSETRQHAATSKLQSKSAASKRRNSCDTGKSKPAAVDVRRQLSDESEVRQPPLKRTSSGELFKRASSAQRGGPAQSSRRQASAVVATSSKPVRLKFGELEDVPSKKSSAAAKGEAQPAAKSKRVRRSMSNNEASHDADKYKRYSLQNVDLSRLQPRADEVKCVFPSTNFESAELPFRPVELTSEIPSDLEVLLSETENTVDGRG